MKLPFLEQTAVGIEITGESIRWVEIDRLGKKLSLQSYGEILHNKSEASLKSGFEELKQKLVAEAYHIGLSASDALLGIYSEEVPYSEEPEDLDLWITGKEKEYESRFEEQVAIQHQLIELDEDSKRCMFQVLSKTILEYYHDLFKEVDLNPMFFSAGVLEAGYSLIYDPDFIEDTSSIISETPENPYLVLFQQGMIHSVYDLNAVSESEMGLLHTEADSYLQTEEASTEKVIHSIPMFTGSIEHKPGVGQDQVNRIIKKIHPLKGKKGFDELDQSYAVSSGVTTKLFFNGLDSFNFTDLSGQAEATHQHDKQECIRLSILLFVPLILFGLLTFALGKITDYQLVESNQIMGQIGDRIEEVNTKRQFLFETRDTFLEAKSIIMERQTFAYIFELIGESITDNVWLEEFDATKRNGVEGKQVRLSGFTQNENSLTSFLKQLEEHEKVERASLIISQKMDEASSRNRGQSTIGQTSEFEILIITNQ